MVGMKREVRWWFNLKAQGRFPLACPFGFGFRKGGPFFVYRSNYALAMALNTICVRFIWRKPASRASSLNLRTQCLFADTMVGLRFQNNVGRP